MGQAEEKGLPYLVKLRLTKNVRKLIEQAFCRSDWDDAGQGWEGVEESLQLMGWQKTRRVVILRRPLAGNMVISQKQKNQMELGFVEAAGPTKRYEYAVLATTLKDEILTIAQHYRDRADAENIFDELKNQWGWGGYTTRDLKRCGFMARIVALVYNWWSLFVRLAHPDKHLEAITSRPLLLPCGRQTDASSGADHGDNYQRARDVGKSAECPRSNCSFLGRIEDNCGAVDHGRTVATHLESSIFQIVGWEDTAST